MSKFPKLDEIVKAFMEDCFSFLYTNSSEEVKDSINETKEKSPDQDELIKKSFVVYSSINLLPIKDKNTEILALFSRKYISVFYECLQSRDKNLNNYSSVVDCCNTYVALFGYKCNYGTYSIQNLFKFTSNEYNKFFLVLDIYKVSKICQDYYEDNLKMICKEYINYNGKQLAYAWINHLQKESPIEILDPTEITIINEKIEEDRLLLLEKEIKSLNQKIGLLTGNNQTLNNKVISMSDEISSVSNENKVLKGEISSMSNENKVLKGEISSLKGEISSVSNENKVLKGEISSVSKDNKVLKGEISSMSNENKVLKDEISSVSKDNKVLKGEISSMSNENKVLKDEISSVSKDNKVLKGEISSVSKDNSFLKLNVKLLAKNFKLLSNSFKLSSQNEKILNNKIFRIEKELSFSNLQNEINNIEISEQFIIYSYLNSAILSLEKTKINYLQKTTSLLNNTIRKLSNPYNFNLWRKISNIILKNIFIILRKKNYKISQNIGGLIINQLKSYESNFKDDILKAFKNKIIELERTKQQNESFIIGTPATDKSRNFNLIIISNNKSFEVKLSLCIEFLFYLKEMGNKINHFDEETLDILLFDDLNIYETSNNINIENEPESQDGDEIKQYTGKTNFTGEEIINMLKNPEKFEKDDFEQEILFNDFDNLVNDIKSKSGYKNNNKINDLKEKLNELKIKLNELIVRYDKYFEKNKIELSNKEQIGKIEKEDEDMKKNINIFYNAKNCDKKINDKLIFYDLIEKKLKNLNEIKIGKEKEISELIDNINSKLKNQAKIITIPSIFNMFKRNLIKIIKKEGEYSKYDKIFNNKNINNFKVEDFYKFLNDNIAKYSFSITKRDVTSYNLLIQVINKFHELKYIYNNNLDVQI